MIKVIVMTTARTGMNDCVTGRMLYSSALSIFIMSLPSND